MCYVSHVPDEYSFKLDDAEIARYRAMAERALETEADLWEQAGITSNRCVLDLGCGPGLFLPTLAERTAPHGKVIAVERSADALQAARALVRVVGIEDRVQVIQADAAATGLEAGSIDVVMMRNVLMHNGARLGEILNHVRHLLTPGGCLLSVETSVDDMVLPAEAKEEQELEERWAAMMRAQGNDPAIGRTLAERVSAHGFKPIATRTHMDLLMVERSPAWTARDVLVANDFASDEDVRRWGAAITARLASAGLLSCEVPFTVVVALPQRLAG